MAMKKTIVKTRQVPFKMKEQLTADKRYEATHIARDMFMIEADDGSNLTIAVGRNCLHLNERKWVRC